MTTIEQLLQRSANNDQAAFKQLYEETSGQLFHLISRYVYNEHIAQEVLQDAYLKIWEKSKQYDMNKGKASTWMSRIAINTAFDKIRSQRIRPQSHTQDTDVNELCHEQDDTADILDIHSAIKQLQKDFKALPPQHQECVLLSSLYGYTHQELSQKMQLPLGTIKSLIRRGKGELKHAKSQQILSATSHYRY